MDFASIIILVCCVWLSCVVIECVCVCVCVCVHVRVRTRGACESTVVDYSV